MRCIYSKRGRHKVDSGKYILKHVVVGWEVVSVENINKSGKIWGKISIPYYVTEYVVSSRDEI